MNGRPHTARKPPSTTSSVDGIGRVQCSPGDPEAAREGVGRRTNQRESTDVTLHSSHRAVLRDEGDEGRGFLAWDRDYHSVDAPGYYSLDCIQGQT